MRNNFRRVATALTVYGIETKYLKYKTYGINIVATALTVYGIETYQDCHSSFQSFLS